MAVFTKLEHVQMQEWLRKNYALELAEEASPIETGIENSNYKICDTSKRHYILTIIEKWSFPTASYCIGLAHHLNQMGLPVPAVLANLAQAHCTELMEKPAVVVEFITGTEIMEPDTNACEIFGSTIARLHASAASFASKMDNPRNHPWRIETAKKMREHLDVADQNLLDEAMSLDAKLASANLDKIACHCDLFRNNVLWHEGKIAGIIDFYFAGDDPAGFDIGVAAVDWSQNDTGNIDMDLLAALARGYLTVAGSFPATPVQMVDLMTSGALRFWLSRLEDIQKPRQAIMLTPHDPQVFRARLQSCLDRRDELLACLSSLS